MPTPIGDDDSVQRVLAEAQMQRAQEAQAKAVPDDLEAERTGSDKHADAVKAAHAQSDANADWRAFSAAEDSALPPSVDDVREQEKKVTAAELLAQLNIQRGKIDA
jgi:hypothetical protein